MIDYRLLNFAGPKGKAIPGIKVGDEVIDLTIAAPIYARRAKKKLGFEVASTLDILKVWSKAKTALAKLAADHAKYDGKKSPYAKAVKPLKRVKLMAPILYPSTVFCIAANYADHHAEMGSPTMPDKNVMPPVFFQKTPAQTVVGHGAEIPLPHTSTQIDWEAELAIVIGKPCFNVPKEKVFDYIAGYMVLNDMSIRGPSKADAITPAQKQFRGDRFRRKNFDGSCPTGPWLTPKELVKNPYDLKIQLWGQRRVEAERQFGRDVLQHRRADQLSLRSSDSAARRRDHHRHPGGRRQGQRHLPQSRRQDHHDGGQSRHAGNQLRAIQEAGQSLTVRIATAGASTLRPFPYLILAEKGSPRESHRHP